MIVVLTAILFYSVLSEQLMRKATNIARENLISLGMCLGKLTKTGKFKLHITALDVIAPYSKVRVRECESVRV